MGEDAAGLNAIDEAQSTRVRCIVLAGWLGSGKTTLLNELLTGSVGAATGEKVAVIVNDVGDVNVDAALIAKADGDRIELTDGCICCSIGSSLALTLRDLIMVEDPPDLIVIEASGVAEPAKVAAYGDRRRMHPPMIVVTVDATDVIERSTDPRFGPMVMAQISQADALVMTKMDLIDVTALDEVSSWLSSTAPLTPVIDRDDVRRLESDRGSGGSSSKPSADLRLESSAAAVETKTIVFGTDVADLGELERLLAQTPGLVRAKGIIRLDDGRYVVMNHAASRLHLDPLPDPSPEHVAIAQQIVLIVGVARNSSPTGELAL